VAPKQEIFILEMLLCMRFYSTSLIIERNMYNQAVSSRQIGINKEISKIWIYKFKIKTGE
jgi:hypothetical protein